MRFMMFVKGDETMEAGVLPDEKLFADMAKYNDELKKAGVLVALDGLHPSSKGARVTFSGGKTSVTHGPFTPAKELVAGYWQIQVKSLEEAIEWAKKVPFKGGVVEIRQIQEMEDFPPEIRKALNS